MKVLVDNYVPFIKGILEKYAEIAYLEPEEFTSERVKDADALIIRTRTRCNETLLNGSKVQFIATATIGFDHIDTAYCQAHHIYWTNSPGCNAKGVCDYVESAIFDFLQTHQNAPQKDKCLGIVGVGHVGSLVAQMAEKHGMRVLLNDPPKGIGVSLETIQKEADIITFHTPLARQGEFATYHICDDAFLKNCKSNVVIINAARGGIIDEEIMSNHRDKTFIIDTWQGEPHISHQTLQQAALATFHIAGYSLQGKINASNMCLAAFCKHFNLPIVTIDEKMLPPHGDSQDGWLMRIDKTLRNNYDDFENLRETYKLR